MPTRSQSAECQQERVRQGVKTAAHVRAFPPHSVARQFSRSAFLEPLIYLQTTDNFTVQLGLNLLNGRYSLEYQQTMAQTIISLIPVLLVFFLAQRRYVQGIVVSGVKG